MERITVNLAERSYPISIGAGLFKDPAYLSQVLANKNANQKVVVISNVTVAPLYANQILEQLKQLGCSASLLELPDLSAPGYSPCFAFVTLLINFFPLN